MKETIALTPVHEEVFSARDLEGLLPSLAPRNDENNKPHHILLINDLL